MKSLIEFNAKRQIFFTLPHFSFNTSTEYGEVIPNYSIKYSSFIDTVCSFLPNTLNEILFWTFKVVLFILVDSLLDTLQSNALVQKYTTS